MATYSVWRDCQIENRSRLHLVHYFLRLLYVCIYSYEGFFYIVIIEVGTYIILWICLRCCASFIACCLPEVGLCIKISVIDLILLLLPRLHLFELTHRRPSFCSLETADHQMKRCSAAFFGVQLDVSKCIHVIMWALLICLRCSLNLAVRCAELFVKTVCCTLLMCECCNRFTLVSW